MFPRFVTKEIHSWLDYPVAFALMGLPFARGLGASGPAALWLSVATGAAALVLTVLTDHRTGLIRVLPYRLHLALDGAVGAVFVLAPVALGFSGIDAVYYWANGGAVLAVVALHRPEAASEAGATQAP